MPREKPLFRVNLDRLDERFPGQEVLKHKDIAEYLGLSMPTVRRRYKYNKNVNGVPKTTLAQALSE